MKNKTILLTWLAAFIIVMLTSCGAILFCDGTPSGIIMMFVGVSIIYLLCEEHFKNEENGGKNEK